jgi:hypothetical protein
MINTALDFNIVDEVRYIENEELHDPMLFEMDLIKEQ